MDKQHILNEIKRTAQLNGGKPLGQQQFRHETGIKESEWRVKHWARWGDALKDAGYLPNKLTAAHDETKLIECLVDLSRELGHFPVDTEIKMKARRDRGFPSHSAFNRRGTKSELIEKVLRYCESHPGNDDVKQMCVEAFAAGEPKATPDQTSMGSPSVLKEGHVYLTLLKLGRERRYKIGNTFDVERRTKKLSAELPEEPDVIHSIRTDDAYGIEAYWHKRFASKRTNGEWFSLSSDDVRAFKRRKFM